MCTIAFTELEDKYLDIVIFLMGLDEKWNLKLNSSIFVIWQVLFEDKNKNKLNTTGLNKN